MKKSFVFFVCMFTLLGVACQPVLKTAPANPAPRLLYQDDFSNPQSGWTASVSSPGTAGYSDGVYRFNINQANQDAWASPGLDLTDTRLEVDAIKVGGDRNNRFGLLCRMSDASHFYIFLISSDGYYGIGKINGDEYRLLGSESLLPTEKIPRGSAYLRLQADCQQDRLTLYVNGVKIAEARDSDFISGDVGILAGAYNTPGVDILFDNFAVYKP
jgi:hypothetical protein